MVGLRGEGMMRYIHGICWGWGKVLRMDADGCLPEDMHPLEKSDTRNMDTISGDMCDMKQ